MSIDDTHTRQLLTAGELARELRLTRGSVYRMAERGQIPRIKIGGRVLFRLTDVISGSADRVRTEVRDDE